MLSLSENVTSPAVYLSCGVFPAEAQRDIEILGLMGQLAVCPDELQNIRTIIENNLAFYCEGFHGWSALARTVCTKYNLPDPLEYFQKSWRPDRWRKHCMKAVGNYWESQLKEAARPKDSLVHFDIESASLFRPTQPWVLASLDSLEVKKATVVNWMQLGVYKTREKLLQFRKAKTDLCLACNTNQRENLHLLIFLCPFYDDIRQPVLSKLFLANPNLTQIIDDVRMKTTLILDPLSKLLPQAVTDTWTFSPCEALALFRTKKTKFSCKIYFL